ncbi:MAG TPA: hypothetical protein VIM12_06830 [Noviherbaspirillum sp.]|jgi:hypothetical protein|uniref:hypothetical protein n=1 Tax=Noviherbaspirillum sp. TaxID=1926288 RepID=UPI002F942686
MARIDIVNDLLWQALLILLWTGSLLAVLLGMRLLLARDGAAPYPAFLDRVVDLQALLRMLNRPRRLERFFYRRHQIVGGLLLAGAVFVLDAFLLRGTKEKIALLVKSDLLGLLDGAVAFLVIASVIGAVIGGVMIWKPSLLREVEAASNRWIPLENEKRRGRSFDTVSRIVTGRTKRVGGLLVLGGLYVSIRLGFLLFSDAFRL